MQSGAAAGWPSYDGLGSSSRLVTAVCQLSSCKGAAPNAARYSELASWHLRDCVVGVHNGLAGGRHRWSYGLLSVQKTRSRMEWRAQMPQGRRGARLGRCCMGGLPRQGYRYCRDRRLVALCLLLPWTPCERERHHNSPGVRTDPWVAGGSCATALGHASELYISRTMRHVETRHPRSRPLTYRLSVFRPLSAASCVPS